MTKIKKVTINKIVTLSFPPLSASEIIILQQEFANEKYLEECKKTTTKEH